MHFFRVYLHLFVFPPVFLLRSVSEGSGCVLRHAWRDGSWSAGVSCPRPWTLWSPTSSPTLRRNASSTTTVPPEGQGRAYAMRATGSLSHPFPLPFAGDRMSIDYREFVHDVLYGPLNRARDPLVDPLSQAPEPRPRPVRPLLSLAHSPLSLVPCPRPGPAAPPGGVAAGRRSRPAPSGAGGRPDGSPALPPPALPP